MPFQDRSYISTKYFADLGAENVPEGEGKLRVNQFPPLKELPG